MNTSSPSCPVCASHDLDAVIRAAQVPTFCNKLQPTREEAMAVTRGDLDMRLCRQCAHFFNAAFDARLMNYDEGHYDNSLHGSAVFRRYAQELASKLVERHDLHRKQIVEIGSGRGEFLKLIADEGENSTVGFEPSPAGRETPATNRGSVEIVPSYFGPAHKDRRADFVICRHVLEHIEAPVEFVRMASALLAEKSECGFYFEVPNALYTLRDLGIWDLIYEHISYFSPVSAKQTFQSAGLQDTTLTEQFGGQYLGIEGTTRRIAANAAACDADEIADIRILANGFSGRFEAKKQYWQSRLGTAAERDQTVVLWGAGSKGVTFLNFLELDREVAFIVDLNPAKHGHFVPGTAQQIVPPQALQDGQPDLVIIMNPNYAAEIQTLLGKLGVQAETAVA